MEPSTPDPVPDPSAPTVWPEGTKNYYKNAAKAAIGAIVIAAALAAPGSWLIYRDWAEDRAAQLARAERETALQRLLAAPAAEPIALEAALRGREIFTSACATCHAPDGTGLPGLGKDIVHSTFVASTDDDALHRFIAQGRPADHPENTTRIPMPPRGGRPDLTDDDLSAVVAYVRALQDPRRMPELPAMAAAPEPEVAAPDLPEDIDPELAAWIASGSKLFATSCASCHGKDARGLPGLGKDLVNSEFCRTQDDEQLLEFVMKGRDPSDPANTTGVGMPPKGGNPALSEDDILDIISYLRSLQDATATN